MPGAAWPHFFTFFAGDGPLEWVRPIPNALERSWDASGSSFSPNGRFWTRFGPFLMIWAGTDIWAGLGPPGPGQGLAGRPWPGPYFFFPHEIQKNTFVLFSEGGSRPPRPAGKSPAFLFSEGVRSQIGISGSARNADLGSDPLRIKKMSGFFLLGGGVADPPPKINKAGLF